MNEIVTNNRIYPWKINVKYHAVVETGSWQFKTLIDLKRFYR